MKNVINRALVAKKKIFLTFMLAIVSGLWMVSEAACIPAGIAAMDPITIIQISGTIQWLGYPCEENEVCPPCLTPAIVTSDKTYYLSTSNPEMQEFLEHMESTPVPSTYLLPLQATASGIPYTRGSYDFLTVNNFYDLYVQYFSDQLTRIPSLCDEWNVLHEPFECMGPYCYLETDIYRLKGDTGISIFIDMPVKYFKLEKNGQYIGALHEGNNRDIYYVPANSQNAYLLYAFNAQVGDTLSNLWVGGFGRDYQGVVQAISNGSPRIFTIGVKFGDEPGSIQWIEGVGSPETPMGMAVVPDVPADIGVYTLLCAYKYGEQVYSSPKAQKYGCEFNGYYVEEHPTDTIPLYIRDDSGTSTVDPVDPNQIYATHTGNELAIHNNTGANVTITMNTKTANNIAAKVRKNTEPITFTESISIELTEDGVYEIWLTSEEWNYSIFGTFNHVRSATPTTKQDQPLTTKKILRGTQILIERGDKTYTLTGQEVK